ncbi:MAG: hypothetical protein JSU98_03130 [Gemmatimonadales bacterium]|nr:MAG: hypothetical protein JSU98_03130 [Gemmatimonadales bacterium]
MKTSTRVFARGLAGVLMALALGASAGGAQGLADYDYDELTFRGIGFELGYIFPEKVEDALQYGMRFDLGYLGPGVRILPRVGYFSSSMTRSEVMKLENRVAELVFDQNPLAPLPSLDLGVIDWSAVTVGVDGQFVWRVPFGVLTYLGGGVAAHFQNGSGEAIDGTFVEDLLDSTVAGFNVHAGLEYPLSSLVRVFGDARYEFLGDLRFGALRGGIQMMIGGAAPGEVRP